MRRQIDGPSRVDRLSKNFIDHPPTPTSVTTGNPRRAAASPRASWPTAACHAASQVGKPDAGNRHVRFDSNSRCLWKFPIFPGASEVRRQQISHVGTCRGGARTLRDRLKTNVQGSPQNLAKGLARRWLRENPLLFCSFSPSNSEARWQWLRSSRTQSHLSTRIVSPNGNAPHGGARFSRVTAQSPQ
jgi:hypothetical protein